MQQNLFVDMDESDLPDAALIGQQNDAKELMKLMELVLGTAVNSDERQGMSTRCLQVLKCK